MRAPVLFCLLLLSVSPIDSLSAKEWVSSELLLDYPPIYFADRLEHKGLYADIQDAVLAEAKIDHQTLFLSSKRNFRDIWHAKIQFNCCSNPAWWAGYAGALEGQLLFSEPMLPMRDIWVFPKGKSFDPKTELMGKQIGMLHGFVYPGLDETLLTRKDSDSSEELLRALAGGQVQAVILNEFVFGWWREHLNLPLEAGPTQDQFELHFVVHPKAQALLPEVNRAISRLRVRGMFADLVRVYLPDYYPVMVPGQD